MLKLVSYIILLIFALALSNCKKDCNGSFTIEGTLWNGTKNQPYTNTKIEIAAGGKSSLYTGALNGKDLGTVYTNNLGKFTFTYNCIDEDDWKIFLNLGIAKNITNLEVPINQNYSQFYNIPDSVSIKVVLNIKSLKPSDTIFLRAPNAPDFSFTDITYTNRYYFLTYQQLQQTNYISTRVGYPPIIGGYYILAAVGYNNYISSVKNQTGRYYEMSLKDPDINVITIDVP